MNAGLTAQAAHTHLGQCRGRRLPEHPPPLPTAGAGACLALAPHAAAVLDARGINISTDATTPMAGLRKWDEVPQGLEGEGRGDADPIWIHIVGDVSDRLQGLSQGAADGACVVTHDF